VPGLFSGEQVPKKGAGYVQENKPGTFFPNASSCVKVRAYPQKPSQASLSDLSAAAGPARHGSARQLLMPWAQLPGAIFMSQARSGDTVRIHYTGKLEDGTQFDTSAGRDPLEFALGSGQVIRGFDAAVTGMTVGEKRSVTIEPGEAYGERHEQLIQEVPRNVLPDDLVATVGMQLQGEGPEGQVTRFVVTEVGEQSITVDANHPLAGQTLNFDIELVEIV
jgi:peptidylprolyl isomerase